MCWICDSTAPVCKAARAPDIDLYFMCGVCDDTYTEEELQGDFSEIFGISTREAGTQTGLGLPDSDVERNRAEPRKRASDQGTIAPSSKIRANRVHS